ncbi:MAG: phosphatase PAP2 family protein, partial [Candidatus Daviesbacteria bacterium]|nr:phosphatase PAP2 family protein [Candidatus Daviesbacteria bacterium]
CLFVYFSYLVAKERFYQYDFDTTVKFQDHIPRFFDLFFSLFSVFGSAEITTIVIIALGIILLFRKFWIAAGSLSLFFISVAIEVYGKVFVHHPGPPHLFYRGVIDFDFPSHYVHSQYSYPSGHMTRAAFIVAFLVTWIFLKWHWSAKILFIPGLLGFLTIMFISRIYLGEHWFSDVFGGLLLGSSFGIISAITIPSRLSHTSRMDSPNIH